MNYALVPEKWFSFSLSTYTWWIDSGTTLHVTNSMHGFLTSRPPVREVNKASSRRFRVEAVRTVSQLNSWRNGKEISLLTVNITSHSTVGYGEGQVRLVDLQYLWFAQCLIIFVVASNIISVMQIIKLCFLIQCIEMISPGDYFYRTSCGGWRPNGGKTSRLCENNELAWKLKILFLPLLQKNLVAALPEQEFEPLCSREVCSCCYEIYFEHYTLSYPLQYWVEHHKFSFKYFWNASILSHSSLLPSNKSSSHEQALRFKWGKKERHGQEQKTTVEFVNL